MLFENCVESFLVCIAVHNIGRCKASYGFTAELPMILTKESLHGHPDFL